MRRPYLPALLFPFLVMANAHAADDPARQCQADLDDIAAFMPDNDSGGKDLLADHGAAIETAFRKAKNDAASVDAAACDAILRTYLRAWRPGHLSVRQAVPGAGVAGGTAQPGKPGEDPLAPQLKLLSKDTLLLVLPTFFDRYQASVEKLVAERRADLLSHKNWIIDVRANGGGSDGTYEPFMGFLLDAELPHNGVEYLVTPANIKAQEEICALTSDPKECEKEMGPVVKAMRAAPAGSFVLKGEQRWSLEKVEKPEPVKPARVAILIDRKCGSSCEQFVLEARTSPRVKVLGRPTYGSIDYSNMRGHPLPSGRVLYYSTTRSTRMPDMRIDGIGI
ncbi:MAG TPA: S41 family peptidase, partial [Telluria sp.]|nr:S41 family peptidase [Telluria sp.]